MASVPSAAKHVRTLDGDSENQHTEVKESP